MKHYFLPVLLTCLRFAIAETLFAQTPDFIAFREVNPEILMHKHPKETSKSNTNNLFCERRFPLYPFHGGPKRYPVEPFKNKRKSRLNWGLGIISISGILTSVGVQIYMDQNAKNLIKDSPEYKKYKANSYLNGLVSGTFGFVFFSTKFSFHRLKKLKCN